MKSYHFIIALLCFFSFTQCSKDDDRELNKGNTDLILTTSSDAIALDPSNPNLEAAKFTWTSGSNFGTNAAISYTFEMDLQGNDFQKGIRLDLGRQVYEKTYTHEELNLLLLNTFGVKANEKANLEVRIKANTTEKSISEQISAVKTINITTHTPISSTLYLIGSASPEGWSADAALQMDISAGNAKMFVWQGQLSAGELKFITNKGHFLPAYTRGTTDNALFLRESDDQPDDKFIIPQAGTYRIEANLITKTISIVKMEGPDYTQLWFVGNATGWSFQPMSIDPLDEFIFYFHADLSAGGEFKIATKTNFDSSTVFYRPETNGQSEGENLSVVKWGEDTGADHKWNISGGIYKIRLNTRTMKIDIKPFTPYDSIYLIGSATSADWNIANAVEMTKTSNAYEFEWTGTLNAGELKFTCDKKDDWNGAWFLADKENKAPTGEEETMHFSGAGSNPDNKWNITESGTYKITLNQLTHKVTIKKQ